ncbi:MAG: glycoside hydrolase [Verrucomicrobia bacterium]|nr:glycoside hydrolase [Verrucomicrobiota bacterium]
MKKNITRETNQQSAAGDQLLTSPVRFEFESATAKAVGVAGTFNEWDPSVAGMHPDGEGRWVRELILPPGTYEYRFVVDGEWADDPRAIESTENPFGGRNAVLKVAAPTCDR